MLKPAPDRPWCAAGVGRLIAAHTDIAPGVINSVTSSDHAVGALLSKDPRVDMVSFTGSTAMALALGETVGVDPHLDVDVEVTGTDADWTARVIETDTAAKELPAARRSCHRRLVVRVRAEAIASADGGLIVGSADGGIAAPTHRRRYSRSCSPVRGGRPGSVTND